MKRRDFLVAGPGFAGLVLPRWVNAQAKICMPPTLAAQPGTAANTTCTTTTAQADWQSRISGPGVVWYHGFDSDNEVNNFRWTPVGNAPSGYADWSGNDPNALGTNASLCRRITTDGPAPGFACLEIVRAAGSNDGSYWWRPFSPLKGGTTSGNGRGAGSDDPGATGSIAALSFAPTNGGSQTSGWGNHGWYANQTYVTANPAPFDGTEYYIQCRVKIDPNRAQPPNTGVDQGKLFYFTRTDRSATDQEIVTTSFHGSTGHDYFSAYRSVGIAWVFQGNSSTWEWPLGQWATILFHVKPGTMHGALGSGSANADPNTVFEAWGAKPGETSYTQICSVTNCTLPFDVQWGHNALIASIYQNGNNMTQFYQRFGQIIFSKSFIPCPQV